jgi:hypothetical protein
MASQEREQQCEGRAPPRATRRRSRAQAHLRVSCARVFRHANGRVRKSAKRRGVLRSFFHMSSVCEAMDRRWSRHSSALLRSLTPPPVDPGPTRPARAARPCGKLVVQVTSLHPCLSPPAVWRTSHAARRKDYAALRRGSHAPRTRVAARRPTQLHTFTSSASECSLARRSAGSPWTRLSSPLPRSACSTRSASARWPAPCAATILTVALCAMGASASTAAR